MSISLPKEVSDRLDAVAREQHLPRSQVVQMAVNKYLFRYEFEKLRKELIPHARKQGIYTDEDVFKLVS